MLVLKQQLKEAPSIPQAVVARAVAVSEATLAQIVNHNVAPYLSREMCASVLHPGWKSQELIQQRV